MLNVGLPSLVIFLLVLNQLPRAECGFGPQNMGKFTHCYLSSQLNQSLAAICIPGGKLLLGTVADSPL